MAVASETSTRVAAQRSYASMSVGARAAVSSSERKSGGRRAANSPLIQFRRATASALRRKLPPYMVRLSRPPMRYSTRMRRSPAFVMRGVIQLLANGMLLFARFARARAERHRNTSHALRVLAGLHELIPLGIRLRFEQIEAATDRSFVVIPVIARA